MLKAVTAPASDEEADAHAMVLTAADINLARQGIGAAGGLLDLAGVSALSGEAIARKLAGDKFNRLKELMQAAKTDRVLIVPDHPKVRAAIIALARDEAAGGRQ